VLGRARLERAASLVVVVVVAVAVVVVVDLLDR